MLVNFPILYIEINYDELIFVVVKSNETDQFEYLHKKVIPIEGFGNNKIIDHQLVQNIIKKNVFDIEQKLELVFTEVILILDDFNCVTNNLSGYKKLNGSQLVRENVTYLLNSLKQKIIEIENTKKVLHIFNTKYLLDKKNVENLPLGLFGNFYVQELSFFLINSSDFKNLDLIIQRCNLKLKKIISKSFIEGVNLISNHNSETFFKIKIHKNNTKLIFFENSSLKFIQNFDFGSDIILKDVTKITSLEIDDVKKILQNNDIFNENYIDECLDKSFFQNKNFRKIKIKLIKDIVSARIKELAEIIIFKNVNTSSFLKKNIPIFLNVNDFFSKGSLREIYIFSFSQSGEFKLNLLPDNNKFTDIFKDATKIVQYGWKKEAVPIVNEKKSLISRIFSLFFR